MKHSLHARITGICQDTDSEQRHRQHCRVVVGGGRFYSLVLQSRVSRLEPGKVITPPITQSRQPSNGNERNQRQNAG